MHVPQAMVGKANALLGSRQGGAYELYSEMVEKFPETDVAMEAKIWKTFLEVPKGKYTYEQAIQIYQQTSQETDNPLIQAHARYAIVGSYYWLQELDKAIDEVEKLIESGLYTTPRSLSIVYNMAAALYNWRGDYAKAFEKADYAVENFPKMKSTGPTNQIRGYALKQLEKTHQLNKVK